MMQPSLDDLRSGIDACWQKKSDIAKLFCLKTVLSDIHNTMTSLATEAFIDWMDTHRQVLGLDKSDIADARERANQKSVNANGFDIAVSGKLYAEVKCNKPAGKNPKSYGAQQRQSMAKDIDKLLHNERHPKVESEAVSGAWKFLVVVNSLGDMKKTQEFVEAFRKTLKDPESGEDISDEVQIFSEMDIPDKNKVQIVVIDL